MSAPAGPDFAYYPESELLSFRRHCVRSSFAPCGWCQTMRIAGLRDTERVKVTCTRIRWERPPGKWYWSSMDPFRKTLLASRISLVADQRAVGRAYDRHQTVIPLVAEQDPYAAL